MKQILPFLLGILFLFIQKETNAQVYINEWMSSNSSVISDPDFDNTGDWIELFNDYNDTLDLTNHFLTDKLDSPTKWSFPANTKIAPNDFLLIWADAEDVGLHTNFKLTKEAEEIGLYSSDTLLLDSIVYGQQATNISMGRVTDGATDLGFFPEPTPGSSNNTPVFAGLTFYQVHFSVKGGFYDTPQQVILSTIGGTIHYTLDGSLPLETSEIYTSPLNISETTNLRARVFLPGFVGGKTVTHTYFFGENFAERGLPVVSISTNPAYFWDTDIGLYVQDFKPEWEYPINIELFENDGSDRAAFNELAGTKVNGLNSWELPQKMLGIYFDNDYDNNNLEYQLFFDGERTKFDNFTLRASGSDWSSTLFRDALCQSLTDENMNLERMDYRPAIAFVNGQYMGIHNLRSRIDENYIEENFGYGNNEYDLIENNGEIEEGDAIAFNELFALFDTDLTNAANFQAVEDIMDVPNFTDYFITEIWSSNSSYGHNIQLWKPKADDTKWRWLLQDFDRGMSGANDNKLDYFTTDDTPEHYEWARTPLLKMLENEDYALLFAQRFTDHLYTSFHPETVKEIIFEFKDKIATEIPNHIARWEGTTSDYGDAIPTLDFWEDQIENRINFAKERQGVMIEDLRDEFSLEDEVNLSTVSIPKTAGHIEINEMKIPNSPWSGPYFQNMPFNLEAIPGVGQDFYGWTAGNFETLIAKDSDWKYLDDGSDQGTAWRESDFNDGSWSTGAAEFGYGDGGEATVISYGDDADNKFITSYFRHTFTVDDISEFSSLFQLSLLRDDAAAVYLNGQELLRSNLPVGDFDYNTGALDFVAGASEYTYFDFLIESELLVVGENVIAIEVHQYDGESSDVSFNFALRVLKTVASDIISTNPLITVNLSSDTFLIANYLPTGECILPREITENTTLTMDCSPYLAPEDVTVLENVNLTVEAGVEIHFPADAHLIIHGNMDVQGTENIPCHFRAIEEGTPWGSVIFKNTTSVSHLYGLEITDASHGHHPIYENAAISAFHATVEMDNLVIEEVFSNPILAYYSDITLRNSQLHSAVTGDLINVKYGNGIVEDCIFRGNNQVDTDAIDFDEVENGIIRHNKIYDFFGFNSDGIDLGEESVDVILEENFIYNCTDKGVSVGQQSSIFAKNNTIVNCAQGFGIKDLATAEIDQNTFYNVAIPVASFEKNIGIGGGFAFVSNSILSNSPDSPVFVDEFSILEVSNTLSDTELLSGMTTVFGHPRFENPTQNDFNLQNSSLAIGAGVDDTGMTIDLGSKIHDFSASSQVHLSGIHYHPLEDADAEYLLFYNPSSEAVDLTDYVISEAVDFVFPTAQISPDETIWIVKDEDLFPNVNEQIFEWTDGKLSNNGETIRLTDAHGIVIDQVTYDTIAPWPTAANGQGDYLALISHDLDNHFAESWSAEFPVSVEDIVLSDILVYPNPTQGLLTIESVETPIETVELVNLIGQTVKSQTFAKVSQAQLSFPKLVSGIYILRVNGVGVEKVLVL